MRREKRTHRWEGDIDYWVNTLSELSDATKESIGEILRFLSFITQNTDLIKRILLSEDFTFLQVDRDLLGEIARKPVVAVDSSISPLVRVGSYFYSIVSAAIVHFEGDSPKPSKNLVVKLAKVPELGDIEQVRKEVLLKMFELEVEALERAIGLIDDGTIFLDGPIVDPPRMVLRGELRRVYEKYVARRARIIAKATKKNIIVIGVVKRILGNHLVSKLRSLFERFPWLNDYTLVTLVFSYITSRILHDAKMEYFLLSRPIELSYEKTDYKLYKENGSGNIFYAYACLTPRSTRGRIVGIEIPTIGKDITQQFRLAVHYSICWTYPGMSIPLPVLLAHKACTIKKKTARKILRELISRYISESLSESEAKYISLIAHRFVE